ncbi:MAG: DUF503 domain-containing protein [Candidatus Marinimicrobia bacterium]|nr:DUF503 domain-containing protein [Candidatus Neomarinimicrobiota bacterium]
MHIALLRAIIDIPDAHNLKDKRAVVRSIKDRVTKHMNVSVAEVGQHDVWNRAELAFVTVAAEKEVVEKRVSAVNTLLEEGRDWVLLEVKVEPL